MTHPFNIRTIQSWLTTLSVSIPEFEHQAADVVMAANIRCFEMLPLLEHPNGIPARRDLLIYAFMEQLVWLHDPDVPMNEPYTDADAEKAKQKLLRYARVHWSEIERIDQEIGFASDDFEKLVALVMADRPNSA